MNFIQSNEDLNNLTKLKLK